MKSRPAGGIAISDFVKALNQIAGLLKFNRKEVSGRDIDPLQINTRLVGSARSNLVGPEVPATLIGLAIEKIVIVLADIVSRIIAHVRRRLAGIVGDGNGGKLRRAQGYA